MLIADLVARVRSEGVQEAAQAVKAVGAEAAQTTRALEIMAAQMSRANPTQGSPTEVLGFLKAANVQPTAAAMAEAAKQAQATTAAVAASVPHTQNAAKAAKDMADAHGLSESTLVKSGAALLGVGLGLSAVVGIATQLHQVIVSTVNSQLDWERSLVTIHGIYGQIGSQIEATSRAQAAAPGVAGSSLEFIQANLAASYLTRRYGLSTDAVAGLTTSAGAASFALGYDQQQRQALQARALAFAEGGGSSLREYGIEGDPLSISRGIGGVSDAQLQALTPGQLKQAQTLIATQGLDRLALFGGQNQPGLLSLQAQKEKALTDAQSALQAGIEGAGTTVQNASFQLSRRGLPANPQAVAAAADLTALQNAVKDAQKAMEDDAAQIGNHVKQLADATTALEKMGVSANTAAFRLLGFFGNPEDPNSIARGDVSASAQAAVASRMRSAIPGIGTPTAEINAVANQTAYEQARQNFIAKRAQGSQDNAIKEWLATQGPEGQTAIFQADQAARNQAQQGEAARQAKQLDTSAQAIGANLQQIALTQQERGLALLRQTVDLRRLDVQQQQIGLAATQGVIRAQQAALPVQQAVSAANFQSNLAVAIGQQRMARLLQGKSVADLPSVNDLVTQNYQGQLAGAELAPAAVRAARGIELAQQPATAADLASAFTATQIRTEELKVDLANLADLPAMTMLQQQLVDNNRAQLDVQTTQRDLLRQMVRIMTGQPPMIVPADQGDRASAGAPAAPSDIPGARRQ